MNKSDLLKTFPTLAPAAIQKVGDECRIVGKYCQVAYLGQGEWDLWLCNPKSLAEGLASRKLNAMLQKLREEATFTELTGEAYTNLQGTQLIENNLDLLGIKRKRRLTEEERDRRRQLINTINTNSIERTSIEEKVDTAGGQNV